MANQALDVWEIEQAGRLVDESKVEHEGKEGQVEDRVVRFQPDPRCASKQPLQDGLEIGVLVHAVSYHHLAQV